MTTDDLSPGLPAAARRGLFRLCCGVVLCAASLAAIAQEAPAVQAATEPSPSSTSLETSDPGRPLFAGELELVVDEPAQPKLGDRIQTILAKAMTLLGTPYRWGGTSPERGFDCSGLVGYVFRTTLGIDLPRVSRQMVEAGHAVERTQLVPGDLVFFGRRGRVNHVGIYIGEGRFLHAPRTGRDVTVSSMDTGYWAGKYLSARRVAM